MKQTRSMFFPLLVLFAFAAVLFSCGQEVELRPELQAHLAEYEALIDEYEVKFAAVRTDRPKFSKVADAYSKEVREWISRWDTVAPDMSDEEGRAVKAQVDRLNKRAERMLMSG